LNDQFNWEHYIKFSEVLLNNLNLYENKETIYRTICSRSYYGAFKPFEDYIRSISIDLPLYDERGNYLGSHNRVIYYIENNIDRNIGRKLKRLKSYRVKADYKAEINLSQRDAENCKRLSKEIYQFFINL
jgi:uncharacterized protein (UPF0332 family)